MVRSATLIALLTISGGAFAQSADDKPRWAPYEQVVQLRKVEDRAKEIRPYRREVPVREENIRDREVEEIRLEMANVMPGAIVNIGTVVTGCPCEDGSSCSAQVWTVAHRPEESAGVLLSKINGHWTIGPVQRWWWEYQELLARREWLTANWATLMERFPACRNEVAVPGHSGDAERQL